MFAGPSRRRNVSATLILLSTIATATPGHAQAGAQATETGAPDPQQDIIVTGTADDPTVIPTGSRINRDDSGTIFQGIATRTGVQGLTPGSGMDPFAGMTSYTSETACRSSDPSLSADAACQLFDIQQKLVDGEAEAARTALHRFMDSGDVSDQERYVAAGLWYQLGQMTGEDMDREDALLAMLGSDAMPVENRQAALRTLVSISLRRDDSASAISLLERLLPLAPSDARSRANLAALYSQIGRNEEAVRLTREAITLARSRGEPVPADWLAFAAHGPDK